MIHQKSNNRIEFSFFLAIVVGIAVLIISVSIFAQGIITNNQMIATLDTGWTDSQGNSIELPYTQKTEPGKSVTISTELTDHKGSSCEAITFKSRYEEVSVKVGNKVVYTYQKDESQTIAKTPPNHQNIVTIPSDSAGKTLEITMSSEYRDYSVLFNEVEYGSQQNVLLRLISKSTPEFLMAVVIIVIGMIFLIGSLISRYRNLTVNAMVWLSMFVIFLGLFMLSDNFLLEVVTGSPYFCTMASNVSFTLLPLPYLLYFCHSQENKLKRITFIVFLLYLVYSIILFSFQVSNFLDFQEMIMVTRLVFTFLIIYCATCNFITEKKVFFTIFMAVTALYSFVHFIQTKEYNIMVYVAVLVYSYYMESLIAVNTIHQRNELIKNKFIAESAINDLLVSQINNHFLFHVLGASRVLVKKDPDTSYSMLGDIQKFLRYRTDSIEVVGGLTQFKNEMEAVNAYVSLKKTLLGDRLNVIVDISNDEFYVPVLTIQPIVENAIEHGIEKKAGGGTVWISEKEEDNYYVVTVRDDGVGFDSDVSKDSASVAQNNIIKRIGLYGKNKIKIESKPGEGTVVRIEFLKDLGGNKDENNNG